MDLPQCLGGGEVPASVLARLDQVTASADDLIADVLSALIQGMRAADEGDEDMADRCQVLAGQLIAESPAGTLHALAGQAMAQWATMIVEANGGAGNAMDRIGKPEFRWPGQGI